MQLLNPRPIKTPINPSRSKNQKTVPAALLYRRRVGRCDRPRDDPGHQPGDRRDPRQRAEDGRRGDPPRDRGGRQGAAGLARQDRQGARPDPAQLVRPDDGEPGRSRPADDRRAGQAARRGEGRDRLCRLVHRMVRRGRQAHLRRHHPRARHRQAHRRHQGADRRLRRDHAVELSGGDDHPQGRPGAGGGLHDGAEAGDRDPLFGAGAVRAGRARRGAEGRVLVRHRRRQGDRRRDDLEPDRAQADLHRLDRDRQIADGAVRRDGEEDLAGTGRQRAVHRLRRRRSRCRGRGRDRLEIPQCRPDLRLRQPHPGAGRGLRRVHRSASPRRPGR